MDKLWGMNDTLGVLVSSGSGVALGQASMGLGGSGLCGSIVAAITAVTVILGWYAATE